MWHRVVAYRQSVFINDLFKEVEQAEFGIRTTCLSCSGMLLIDMHVHRWAGLIGDA